MGLLRIILIGLVLLFVYRLIKSVLFPPQNRYYKDQNQYQKKAEGETTIHPKDKKSSKDSDKGEYIDYEEVD